ncbi:MAG: carboxylesterase family protein [Streptosporangiaceae bacterium]
MTETVDGALAVQVEGGRLRGWTDRGVAAFLGIPYAAPPFGARRMRPPEPPGRWEGERSATDYWSGSRATSPPSAAIRER